VVERGQEISRSQLKAIKNDTFRDSSLIQFVSKLYFSSSYFFYSTYLQIENERMIVWQVEDHVAFVPENGALSFRAVTFADSGEYHCVVNGKKEDGVVRFFVQGKKLTVDYCLLNYA